MSGILFPDLAAAFGAAEATSASKAQRDYINEDRETGKYFGAALKGDPDAQARVMTNPRYASALSSQLERIEVGKRAKVKEDADYITGNGMAILNAPADQQPGLYARVRQEAAASGRDVSQWPATYDPGWVQFNVNKAMSVKDHFDRQNSGPQAMPPPGGGAMPPASAGGGVNSNNIGNVRPVGDSSGFQQPATLDDGIRLAVNNVKAYPAKFNGGQPMSLMQIGARWAPVGDGANDPAQWARNVGSIGGLNPNQPLDFNDPATAAAFARGLHGAEHGASKVLPLERYAQVLTGGGQRGMPVGREVDIATNAAPMPEPPPGMAVPGNPAQMPGGSGAPPGMAVGDTQPRADASGNALPPPAQAPGAAFGQEFDDLRTKLRATGGDIYTKGRNGEVEVQNGNYVVRSIQNPRQIVGMIPVKPAKEPGSGPFTGQSPEAQGLNMLIADGTLTVQQAANIAAGKTITDPKTGQILFATPLGLMAQGPDGQVRPVAPNSGPAPQPAMGTGQAAQPSPAGAPQQGATLPSATSQRPGMIPLTSPKEEPMTEWKAKALDFAKRMATANTLMDDFAIQGTSKSGRFLEALPGGVGNLLQTPEYQQFEQAKANFLNAKLRDESGALIGADEFIKGDKQYFPQPGQATNTKLLAQMSENRRQVVESMMVKAGVLKPNERYDTPVKALDPAEKGRYIFDAKKAISDGRDSNIIKERLKKLGVDPAELDAK